MTRPYVVTITTTYHVDAADADDAVERAGDVGRLADMAVDVEPLAWPETWTRDYLHRRGVAR